MATSILRRALTLLLLAAVLVACAKDSGVPAGGASTDASTTGAAAYRTVTIDRADAGTTTTLGVGDHLVLELGTLSSGEWRLTSYPQDALALVSSRPELGSFEFETRAAGGGPLVAVTRPECGPSATVPCRSPGEDAPADAAGNAYPPRPFSVTVRVT